MNISIPTKLALLVASIGLTTLLGACGQMEDLESEGASVDTTSATIVIAGGGGGSCTTEGAMRCNGKTAFDTCNQGVWVTRSCGPGTTCQVVAGILTCQPGLP